MHVKVFLLVKFSCCIFTLLELHGKTSYCFVSSVIISVLLTYVIKNMPEVSLRTVSYYVRFVEFSYILNCSSQMIFYSFV